MQARARVKVIPSFCVGSSCAKSAQLGMEVEIIAKERHVFSYLSLQFGVSSADALHLAHRSVILLFLSIIFCSWPALLCTRRLYVSTVPCSHLFVAAVIDGSCVAGDRPTRPHRSHAR